MPKSRSIDTKRLTEKLRLESERRFRSLIRYIPDVLWTVDKDLRLVYVSPNFKAITGYTPDEEYKMDSGMGWVGRIHPDDIEAVRKAQLRLFQEKGSFNLVYRLGHKEGRWVWVHDRAIAVDEKNGVKYAHGLITDITAQKEVELEVNSLKEKYESVLRNVPDTIYSALPDQSCSMVFISDKYEKWTGYSPQDFYNDPDLWAKTIHAEDRERAVKSYVEACRNKRPYFAEYRVMHKESGQIHWVRDHGVPVFRSNGNVLFFDGVITDITEQKKLRNNMQFYIRQVTVAQEDERKRLSREIHDGAIQYLADLYSDIDRIVMKAQVPADTIEQILQLRVKVYGVMEQLRHFSHELRPGLMDELGLIPSLELLAEEIERKGITCNLDVIGCKQRLPAESEIMLFRVAQEALRNIRKHSSASEVSIYIEFSDKKVMFDIHDNGTGFDVPATLSGFAAQHKLGIMGMEERVRLVGGSFCIKSKVGGGTRITVEIPLETTTM